MTIIFEQAQGRVLISQLGDGISEVKVNPNSGLFSPITNIKTRYSPELIKLILETKGACYLCDELAREEDPTYVRRDLEVDLNAYFPDHDFAGKRILDFGCGSGASSMIISRLFPKAEIVGVELEEKLLTIAKARKDFYGYKNIAFHVSPSGAELPSDIGEFDLVILSAVYEHLLPNERQTLVPLVWKHIAKGGYLFLNMTPHRYFPVEHHTTRLFGINYLPDKLAYWATRKFSNRTDPAEDWETYLRRGIRGATENEISRVLNRKASTRAILLEPKKDGMKDRIDLWYSALNQDRMKFLKNSLKVGLKTLKALTGVVLVPNLSLVFLKK